MSVDIVKFLLGFTQNFLPNIKYNSVQAAIIGAIMRIYFKIEEPPMCSQRTTLIPTHNIRRGSQHIHTIFPRLPTATVILYNMARVLGIEKDIQQIPTHRAYGHGDRSIWLHNPYLLGVPMVGRKGGWRMVKNG